MITPEQKNRIFLAMSFVLGIALASSICAISSIYQKKTSERFHIKRLYPHDGHHANPLLLIERPEGGDRRFMKAKSRIQRYIYKAFRDGVAKSVSVYLKDADTGIWIGINADDNFSEASLIKVPLMMAYLKKAENSPGVLKRTIKYSAPTASAQQNIIPRAGIQLGKTYTVEELLRYMIVYSDNAAADLLYRDLDPRLLDELYADLQLDYVKIKTDHLISVRNYASFFRVLYSATYLDNDMSEKALDLLLQTDFPDGIVAGVPPNIPVAQKFGERAFIDNPEKQLHDCGIVYLPDRPYLICVMTRGEDFNALKDVIKEVSKIAYEELSIKPSGLSSGK